MYFTSLFFNNMHYNNGLYEVFSNWCIIGKIIILDNVQFKNTAEVPHYLNMIFIINSKIKEFTKLIVLKVLLMVNI